ncbi:sulfur carrier protein ThiS [Motiliproteus sp.]|uniref:sulfur carrier protein ThiS n=1 Tax=Motiliproteus sp. TaxID=1898955 RepID=UPI003BACFE17
MIEIELNGEAHQLSGPTTVAELLQQLGLGDKRVAVEYNLDILPKGRHTETPLSAGDRVEIVHAIGGG